MTILLVGGDAASAPLDLEKTPLETLLHILLAISYLALAARQIVLALLAS